MFEQQWEIENAVAVQPAAQGEDDLPLHHLDRQLGQHGQLW